MLQLCVFTDSIIIGIVLAQTLPIIVAKDFAGGNDIVSAKGKI